MHGRCHINFGPCLIEFSGVVLSCFFCESRGGRPVPNSTIQFFTLSRSAVFTELFHVVTIDCFNGVVSHCLDQLFSLSCFTLSRSTVFTELFHVVSIDCFPELIHAVSIYCFHCFMLSPSTVFTELFHVVSINCFH